MLLQFLLLTSVSLLVLLEYSFPRKKLKLFLLFFYSLRALFLPPFESIAFSSAHALFNLSRQLLQMNEKFCCLPFVMLVLFLHRTQVFMVGGLYSLQYSGELRGVSPVQKSFPNSIDVAPSSLCIGVST